MAKWISVNKILQLKVSSCVICLLCLIAVVQFFASHGEYNYDHIPREDLIKNIYFRTNPNLIISNGKPKCDYEEILQSTISIHPQAVLSYNDDFTPKKLVNGSYVPENCSPLLSVAVILAYRSRQNQLDTFMPYMHEFLSKQGIHYAVYLVEQQDDKPFNKGLLINVGAKRAIADKYPCLVLHDVDLMPLDPGNLYACLLEPRHMSASVDKFRYVLTYRTLVGGAMAVRADQYLAVNGFSNRFHGWGGEDDDFAGRIAAKKLRILRFPPELSRYTMILHGPEAKNAQRERILSANTADYASEGFSSVRVAAVTITTTRLYTRIGVRT